MDSNKTKSSEESFKQKLWPAVSIGVLLTLLFYGAILAGPLDYTLLRRYCLCHEVAVITVGLFWICAVALTWKVQQTLKQSTNIKNARKCILEVLSQGVDQDPTERVKWLSKQWSEAPAFARNSYLGMRVTQVLHRQTMRGHCSGLDEDLRELAHRDSDRQHESYGMVRIAVWAMPMLGFLGTVIGIASTLGQIDSEMLASGSQEAMNRITAGLYVAFDKTAIALALTMVTMFYQFGVFSFEHSLLSRIDAGTSESLVPYLSSCKPSVLDSTAYKLISQFSDAIGRSVAEANTKQSDLLVECLESVQSRWNTVMERNRESTEAANRQALNATETAYDTVRQSLLEAVDSALAKHSERVSEHESASLIRIDKSRQKWQSAIDEHCKFVLTQQSGFDRHISTLRSLLEELANVASLEASLNQNLQSLANVERFEHIAISMTEAIAYLGTHLDRVNSAQQPVRRAIDGSVRSIKTNIKRAA